MSFRVVQNRNGENEVLCIIGVAGENYLCITKGKGAVRLPKKIVDRADRYKWSKVETAYADYFRHLAQRKKYSEESLNELSQIWERFGDNDRFISREKAEEELSKAFKSTGYTIEMHEGLEREHLHVGCIIGKVTGYLKDVEIASLKSSLLGKGLDAEVLKKCMTKVGRLEMPGVLGDFEVEDGYVVHHVLWFYEPCLRTERGIELYIDIIKRNSRYVKK